MKKNAAVAVIGAGWAGLACARVLAQAGCEVTVFDKSRVPGGRGATRMTELGSFDHGAQYFTARDPRFVKALDTWVKAGHAALWSPRVDLAVMPDAKTWMVGTPTMRALGEAMAAGLAIHYEKRVTSLERVGGSSDARWALTWVQDDDAQIPIEITEGLYDAVVVTAPSAQSCELLQAAPALAARAKRIPMRPSWTLMLGFSEPLDTDFDARSLPGPRLNWIARDSSKPGRRSGERWIANASHAWSEEHLADDPADVQTKLVKAFHEAVGTHLQPVHAVVHRWRYAAQSLPSNLGFLWDEKAHIGACGDWCIAPRLESAWLSGLDLADEMLGTR